MAATLLDSLLKASTTPQEYLKKISDNPRASKWIAAMNSNVLNPEMVRRVSKIKDEATLVCFSAYWCKDCLKHVPSLVKTLKEAGNRRIRLAILDYDLNKKLAEEAAVKAIPTFIIYEANGTEKARIVENPSAGFESIEEELLSKLAMK